MNARTKSLGPLLSSVEQATACCAANSFNNCGKSFGLLNVPVAVLEVEGLSQDLYLDPTHVNVELRKSGLDFSN